MASNLPPQSSPTFCPCGSGQAFRECCQPYLAGQAHAPTAEALMRSRYTAYYQGQVDYLIATHHPSRRTPDQRTTLAHSVRTTVWVRLSVLATQQGQPQDRQGTVEFVAYHSAPQPGQIHERSRFIKPKERWFYLEGDMLPPLLPKRNEPCWCGSGKKYKACHG
jgi:SEC-C motif-containing protein